MRSSKITVQQMDPAGPFAEKLIKNGNMDVDSKYDDRRNLLDSYQKKCTLLSSEKMMQNIHIDSLFTERMRALWVRVYVNSRSSKYQTTSSFMNLGNIKDI
jgi:hypothetical protein